MPRVMTEAEIDPIAEEVDQRMMETGEADAIPIHKVDMGEFSGDLSNGGRVGQAEVIPVGESGRVVFDKRLREPGRPTVRAVWAWDGRPSTIPLAYEPSGKRHDGGRRYLLKRHCVICNYTGFYGPVCPACRKDGRELAPVMPAFYLSRSQVPKATQFFGTVDCFVSMCVRRGKYGFMDEPQMRQHAMGRHRMEYRAFQDSQQASRDREMESLRGQVNALINAQFRGMTATQALDVITAQSVPLVAVKAVLDARQGDRTEEQKQAARDRMARARAARKAKVAVAG